MTRLDIWEAEAKSRIAFMKGEIGPRDVAIVSTEVVDERLLSLIEALREYERAIEFYAESGSTFENDEQFIKDGISSESGFYGTGKMARQAREKVRKILAGKDPHD